MLLKLLNISKLNTNKLYYETNFSVFSFKSNTPFIYNRLLSTTSTKSNEKINEISNANEKPLKKGITPRENLDSLKNKFVSPAFKNKLHEYSNYIIDVITGKRRKTYSNDIDLSLKDIPESTSTGLQIYEKKLTPWQKKWHIMKERFEKSHVYNTLDRTVKLTRRNFDTSENVIIKNIRDSKQMINEKIEDIRDTYETSQHPTIWKIRDTSDRLFGETDTGRAIGEIHFNDNDFTIPDFLQEMEEYMIPAVIFGYLKYDMELMRSVMEDNALRAVVAEYKQLQTLAITRDDTLLDIDTLEFINADFMGKTPILNISFRCQHVHCNKDFTGKVVDGSESTIMTSHHSWSLRRDLTSQDFNWKIIDMKVHGVVGLL